MAKLLAQKLKPLVGQTDSFVKDLTSFIKEWNNIKLQPSELLVSFDVVSLFTKIPIQEVVDVIKQGSDEDTSKLVSLYLSLTFFSF